MTVAILDRRFGRQRVWVDSQIGEDGRKYRGEKWAQAGPYGVVFAGDVGAAELFIELVGNHPESSLREIGELWAKKVKDAGYLDDDELPDVGVIVLSGMDAVYVIPPFGVSKIVEPFFAIGSGAKAALGAVHYGLQTSRKVEIPAVLQVVETIDPNVSGPFIALEWTGDSWKIKRLT